VHARLCLVPMQTINEKPANLIYRHTRWSSLGKQH